VNIGARLKLINGENSKKVVVLGIIDTGNTTIDSRIFMPETAMRTFLDNPHLNANEIAISLHPQTSAIQAKEYVLDNFSFRSDISVQTAEETLPKAISDMKKTFSMLGNLVGAISLIVGAITIFIVIFVNAVTRRKYIGILKGIGISSRAIEISYIIQALFYAIAGIALASYIIIWFLDPWFDIHPLQFPVTKGSLAITTDGLFNRGLILLLTAFASGYTPAVMITKQNTLDAILGR